jgi:hypothetical protein
VLWMSLRDAVLACWIFRRLLEGNECSLSRDSTLKLCLHFLRAALFKWVGAAAQSYPRDHERG